MIVGGGSAGSALANRLSADPARTVTLLEAGGPLNWWDLLVKMPMAMPRVVGSARHDWRFVSEPEPHLFGRRLDHPRGRLLGGSSSINGSVYQRGHPADYDGWGAGPGMDAWDNAHCLPYFMRVEDAHSPDAGPTRGHGGPHELDRAPAAGPLFEAFLQATQQAGYQRSDDLNEWQEGFGRYERTLHRGRRVSAADAYLTRAVRRRKNLRIECHALVVKVEFDGRRAVGVHYRSGSGPERFLPAGEVILAGGTFNTPQLLLLSGVGQADELRALDIPVVQDLPGVGRDVQDHAGLFIQHRCLAPVSAMPYRERRRWPAIGARWLVSGTGPGSSTQIEAGGFVRSHDGAGYPDLQLAFAPVLWGTHDMPTVAGHGYQLDVCTGRSESRGRITLHSTDPTAPPALLLNYLSTEAEREFWPRALRLARDVLSQPAFRGLDGGELSPGPEVGSDEELLDWVRHTVDTGLHPTSSCRMGTDDGSVVDPATMGVHGIEGLRVVDASVMPAITNANTYAPVMMIAEKAADIILGNAPLPPVLALPAQRRSSPTSEEEPERVEADAHRTGG